MKYKTNTILLTLILIIVVLILVVLARGNKEVSYQRNDFPTTENSLPVQPNNTAQKDFSDTDNSKKVLTYPVIQNDMTSSSDISALSTIFNKHRRSTINECFTKNSKPYYKVEIGFEQPTFFYDLNGKQIGGGMTLPLEFYDSTCTVIYRPYPTNAVINKYNLQ